MEFNSKDIQEQYTGFLNTQTLWNNSFYGLKQLNLPPIPDHAFDRELTKNTRLGKRVESFVSCYLQHYHNIEIKQENIQIQKGNRTIGELDCILLLNDEPIHLEIIYKFYLYDETIGYSEIDRWIGPNRNDSLVEKIKKLRSKQLPMLFKEETKQYLHVNVESIKQMVLFKAQLFVPFAKQQIEFNQLNSGCVSGFYIHKHELMKFNACKFYIPRKLDWLLVPHQHVDWIPFDAYAKQTETEMVRKSSLLCWMKQPNGEIFKFFLIWWES